jgi:hypothetical protein
LAIKSTTIMEYWIMWPSKSPSHVMTFKEKVETAQAIVTIAAVFVGGLWTYNVFIKERQEYPHANIEQKLSHVVLSEQVNVLRVGVDVSNTGSALMRVGKSIIRVQQILPLLPCPKDGVCAANEVNDAIETIERQNDRFSWPLLAERDNSFPQPLDIEPGEKQLLEFEFVVPRKLRWRAYTSISATTRNLRMVVRSDGGRLATMTFGHLTVGERNESKDSNDSNSFVAVSCCAGPSRRTSAPGKEAARSKTVHNGGTRESRKEAALKSEQTSRGSSTPKFV